VAPLGLVEASETNTAPATEEPPVTTKRKAIAAGKQTAASKSQKPSAPMVIETSPISVRLRRSRRIIPLSTRVTPEFDQLLRETAAREGVQFIDVLERALMAYVGGDE
jgi:hypothetical protein